MNISPVQVSILVVNHMLGLGLLNMPYATKYCGPSNLTVMLVILFLITILTMTTLAYCSDISHSLTYEGAVRTVCGTTVYRITAVTLAIHSFGTCVLTLVVVGDQWKEIFLFISKDFYCSADPWYMHKTFIVPFTSVVFILPLCYLETMGFLAYTSGLGTFGISYLSVLVTVKYFTMSHTKEPEPSSSSDIEGLSLAMAPLLLSYDGHLPIVPIYSCMAAKKLTTFCSSVTVAIFICTVLYGLTGIFGYLTFGNSVTSNFLLSYEPKTDIFLAVLMLLIKTYTDYPVEAFCGREALLSLWYDIRELSEEEQEKPKFAKKRRIIVSSVWFFLSLCAALYVPYIGIIVRHLGVLSVLFVLIYPGLCLFFLKENVTKSLCWTVTRLNLASVFIIFGVFLMALTLVQTIQADIIYQDEIRPDASKFTC